MASVELINKSVACVAGESTLNGIGVGEPILSALKDLDEYGESDLGKNVYCEDLEVKEDDYADDEDAQLAEQDLAHYYDDFHLHDTDSDLDQLLNALVMFIVDGRIVTETKKGQFAARQGLHATGLYDKLVARLYYLSSNGENCASSSSHFYTTGNNTATKQDHLCLKKFSQCQIASKLRFKIEKCMIDHLSLLRTKKGTNNERSIKSITNISTTTTTLNRHRHLKSAKEQLLTKKSTFYSNYHHYQASPVNENHLCDAHTISSDEHNHNNNHNQDGAFESFDEPDRLATSPSDQLTFKNYQNSSNGSAGETSNHYLPLKTGLDSAIEKHKLCASSCSNSSGSNPQTRSNSVSAPSASTSSSSLSSLTSTTSSSLASFLIDVYLLPDCCYRELTSQTGDNLIDISHLIGQSQGKDQKPFTFELLERWSISMITGKKNDETTTNTKKSLLKINELFQAIRSYLHFSQISSWISQTKGQQPQNIAYSITCTNRKCTDGELGELDKLDDGEVSMSNELVKNSSDASWSSPLFGLTNNEFDFQTFPMLNLLFSNNKITFANTAATGSTSSTTFTSATASNTSATNQSHRQVQDLLTKVRVNLYSRKRSYLTNNIPFGIPQQTCHRLHTVGQSSFNYNNSLFMNGNKTSMPLPIQTVNAANSEKDNHGKDCTKTIYQNIPYWSSLMASPHVSDEDRSIMQNGQPSQTLNLLTPTSVKTTARTHGKYAANIITTPTSFSSSPMFLFRRSSRDGDNETSKDGDMSNGLATNGDSSSSSSAANICLISQSPKVLVSNYQIVTDLCTYTKAQLNLYDQNNNNNSQENQNRAEPAEPSVDNHHSNVNLNKRKLNYFGSQVEGGTAQPNLLQVSTTRQTNNEDDTDRNKAIKIDVMMSRASEPLLLDLNRVKSLSSSNNNNNNDNANNSEATLTKTASTTGETNPHARVGMHESHHTQSSSSSCHCLTSPTDIYKISLFKKTIKEPDYNENDANQEENLPDNALQDDSRSKFNPNDSNKVQQSCAIKQTKIIQRSTRSSFHLSSSPAPMRKIGSSFNFDNTLKDPKSIKNALTINNNIAHNKINKQNEEDKHDLANGGVMYDDGVNNTNNNNNGVFDNSSDNSPWDSKTNLHNICNGSNAFVNETNDESIVDKDVNNNGDQCAKRSDENRKSRLKVVRQIKYNCKTTDVQFSYSNINFNSMSITPNCLLGSFEESLLNGRMNPVGIVDGFYAEIGASGSFFPEHATLPVYAAFYQVCEDIAASPYLGVINLGSLGKRGYKVPNKGTIQVTLFNPNNTVVKMFVVMYDLSDMPPGHRTFLRQRTMYVPLNSSSSNNGSASSSSSSSSTTLNQSSKSSLCKQTLDDEDDSNELKSYLRYLIHLRFATSKSGKMYLHTNIKLIFARNKCEIDPRLARYEYKTFTEAPKNPKYSPKK